MSNIEKGTKDRVKQMPWKHTIYHLISAGFVIEGLPPDIKQPYPNPSRWNTATIDTFFNACFANQISVRPADDIERQMVMDNLQAWQDAGKDCLPMKGRGQLRNSSAANLVENLSPSSQSSVKSTTAPDMSSSSKKLITIANEESDNESFEDEDEDEDDPCEI